MHSPRWEFRATCTRTTGKPLEIRPRNVSGRRRLLPPRENQSKDQETTESVVSLDRRSSARALPFADNAVAAARVMAMIACRRDKGLAPMVFRVGERRRSHHKTTQITHIVGRQIPPHNAVFGI